MQIIRRKYNIYYHAINTEHVVNFYVLEFFKNKFYFIWVLCLHVYHMGAQCLQNSEEGIGFPKTRVKDRYEPLCGHLELNLGPLVGQPLNHWVNSSPSHTLLTCDQASMVDNILKEKGGHGGSYL